MKKNQIILSIYVFFMLFIFLISTTNLLIDENYKKVYDISIIFDDVDSEKYDKLKMGFEDSTFDLYVDINFVYLDKKWDVEGQKDAILNEVDRGVDGIIVLPVDNIELSKFIDESAINIPIISIGEEIESNKINGYVNTDYIEMGNKIASDINYKWKDKEVVAFIENSRNNVELYNSISSELYEYDIFSEMVYYNDDGFKYSVDKYDKNNTVFIALDIDTTKKFVDEFLSKGENMILYGVGYLNEFLYYLNTGKIESLSLYDEYLAGYISVRNLIYSIDDRAINKNELIPNYRINKGEVYDNEDILFPID